MKAINGLVLSGDVRSQKLVVQACIPFLDLSRHSVFSYMRDPNENPYKNDSEDDAKEKNQFYQRRIDTKRISKIKDFIRNSILDEVNGRRAVAVFPTAMILSYVDENTNYQIGGFVPLIFPYEVYIVDGQHRLYAMQELYKDACGFTLFDTEKDKETRIVKEYIENYKFNCTILLNFDLWEQSQIFVEVNFNQRKVSKSLYYDIYGMYYNDSYVNDPRNYIYVAHMLVKHMNSSEDSPLKGKIKMLGSGIGLVSQSCFAESLIRNLSSRMSIWRIDSDDNTGKPSYKYMAMELKAFYQEVETVFRDIWPVDNKHRSIICKTTGISVMIRMLGYIHQNVLSDDICQGLKEANTDIVPQYKKVVHDELMKLYYERHRLFGLNGSYSKTGGKGIEKSLYRDMCDILSAKVEDLAEDTLSALKIWLSMYPDSGQPLDNEHYNLFITKAKANGDKITGYILAEVLKQVQPSWNPQKVSVFVAQEIERININL
ncbi:DGQHR domain-containing protein [uncultured Prevotella sp.]|uniref:DGQHR domain-containing protein n=1 Tax=uncultured Prevotella sp. TaxID=159272 RepID=UPI00266C0E5F|nr:DGQHR domain-containing protein [uncultured Prevotella sp.]